MVEKIKPLNRQDIDHLLVTDADAFTQMRYLRHRESVPRLSELETKGQQAMPGIEGALCDLYHTLWNPEPSVKEEVAPDRKYWQQMIGEAVKSNAYQELHSQTQLKELQSVLGTISMGESVLALVPKEDQQKLQELQQAQAEADEMSQEAQDLQNQAKMAQQLADAAQSQESGNGQSSDSKSDGQPQSGNGQPNSQSQSQSSQGNPSGQPSRDRGDLTSEQAKAIANQLAQAAADAQANAQAAKELADEAKAKAEKLADNLLGKPGSEQAEQKLRELARMGLQAVKDANTKVQEVSETIESWGLEEGELFKQGIPESLALVEKMRKNTAFKKFAQLLGRIRKIAARKAKSKTAGEGVKVTVQETGRDLKRAQPAELIALTNPAMKTKALQRWAHGELRLFGQKTKAKLGHGPVIVCEDSSGSMDGEKQQWAKAVTLAMANYAKIQKRSFGWIMFDSRVKKSKVFPQGKLTTNDCLELAESRSGGGTDFERPLQEAIKMIKEQGLKKADICFITDGDCDVSDKFLTEFRSIKKNLEINVFTVLCDVDHTTDSAVKQFSDRIDCVSDFTADTAERVFSHL